MSLIIIKCPYFYLLILEILTKYTQCVMHVLSSRDTHTRVMLKLGCVPKSVHSLKEDACISTHSNQQVKNNTTKAVTEWEKLIISGEQTKKMVRIVSQGRLPERVWLRMVTRGQPRGGGQNGETKAEKRKARLRAFNSKGSTS